jgi:hypothetical protein
MTMIMVMRSLKIRALIYLLKDRYHPYLRVTTHHITNRQKLQNGYILQVLSCVLI